jgi:hypothetical protein
MDKKDGRMMFMTFVNKRQRASITYNSILRQDIHQMYHCHQEVARLAVAASKRSGFFELEDLSLSLVAFPSPSHTVICSMHSQPHSDL